MDELDELVENASKFPSLDSRFTALEFFVESLSEFIDMKCDQAEVRLKAQINRETDPVSQGELESELIQLLEKGKFEFSLTICGSVLVSIYFAYESSVINIFNHFANENSLPSFDSYKRKEKR